MDWLEQELKQTLARKPAPPGLEEKILRRSRPERRPLFRRWLAAAAAFVALTTGSLVEYRQYRGEQAKRQLITAMKITAVKLNRIQTRLQEVRQ